MVGMSRPARHGSNITHNIQNIHSNHNSTNRHQRGIPLAQVIIGSLLSGVVCFYAGFTLGTGTAVHHHMHTDQNAADAAMAQCPTEQDIQQRIQLALQQKSIKQQQQQQQEQPHDSPLVEHTDTERRFPETMADIAQGMARMDRDEFAQFFELGFPLDPTTPRNRQVLLIYGSEDAIPMDNPFAREEILSAVPPPLLSVPEATVHCDYMNLILTDHSSSRHQCIAIMGQYESFHVHKYMRVESSEQPTADDNNDPNNNVINNHNRASGRLGKLDSAQALRLVNRGYQSSGRRSMKPPSLQVTQEYWKVLTKYLNSLPSVLEKLKPLAAQAAAGGKDHSSDQDHGVVIVMVCNHGQSELLLNFLCAAQHRGLEAPLRHLLIFATDMATYDLVQALQIPGVQVFYDEINYGDMPEQAARKYADQTFMRIMMAKVFCVHMTMVLGYSVLFQDADLIWYKDPLPYFRQHKHQYDAFFQDDGNHALYYAPYSANTGFYYLAYNERSLATINALLMQGDNIITTKSHQIPLTFILQEMASLHGLRIKIFSRTEDDFPGGHAFHRRKSFMKDILAGAASPFIFHMSWTASMINKVKFFQQWGEWYVAAQCQGHTVADLGGRDAVPACCLAEPYFECHYRDKPSREPCPDSPSIDKNGRSFW